MTKQRATIVQQVPLIFGEVETLSTMEENEPLMRLEDGRIVVASHCDRFIPEGTEGEAELDDHGRWTFTPNALQPGDLL